MVVAVERFIGEARRAIHFRAAAKGEGRFDLGIGRGIERLHRARAGGHFLRANEEVASERHERPPCTSASAATSSAVLRISCAKVGPFSSWAACIISFVKAAVASRTSVT